MVPSSESGENSLGRPSHSSDSFVEPWFFCRPPSGSAADRTEMLASCSRTEWAPRNCMFTARFDEKLMGLQVPAYEEELEDTASSKLQPERPVAAAAIISSPLTGTGTDCRQKRRVVDILAGLVPHSEVGENSPGMPSHFSDGISRDWFFSNLSDLATVCSSSEWGPRKCQSTARSNNEREPQLKPPRRISEAPSAHNLKPRHVSAIRRGPRDADVFLLPLALITVSPWMFVSGSLAAATFLLPSVAMSPPCVGICLDAGVFLRPRLPPPPTNLSLDLTPLSLVTVEM